MTKEGEDACMRACKHCMRACKHFMGHLSSPLMPTPSPLLMPSAYHPHAKRVSSSRQTRMNLMASNSRQTRVDHLCHANSRRVSCSMSCQTRIMLTRTHPCTHVRPRAHTHTDGTTATFTRCMHTYIHTHTRTDGTTATFMGRGRTRMGP